MCGAHDNWRSLFTTRWPYNSPCCCVQREFERFGAVVTCRIPLDRETQRPRGFGFISMAGGLRCGAAAFQETGLLVGCSGQHCCMASLVGMVQGSPEP